MIKSFYSMTHLALLSNKQLEAQMSVPKDLQVELIGSKITNCAILITEQRISKIEKVKTKLAILFHLTNSLGVATATTLHK